MTETEMRVEKIATHVLSAIVGHPQLIGVTKVQAVEIAFEYAVILAKKIDNSELIQGKL